MISNADRARPRHEPLDPLRAVEKILEWRHRVAVITIDGVTFSVPAGHTEWTLDDLVKELREDGLDAFVLPNGSGWSYRPSHVEYFSINVLFSEEAPK
jgi:hypothetical protein